MKRVIVLIIILFILTSCASVPEVTVPADILKAIETNSYYLLENCDLASSWPTSSTSFEFFPVQDGNVTRVASYYGKVTSVGDLTVNFHRDRTTVFQNQLDITGTKTANEAIVEANRQLSGLTVIKLDFTVTRSTEGPITIDNFTCTAIHPR